MLDGGGNAILFPPFDGLSVKVPPVLPFFRLHSEQLVVVQVDGVGISDGIGCDGDGDRCVGNGGRHFLSYGRGKDPEYIGSNGWIFCVFVFVAFIYSRPCCRCLIVCNTAGYDKLG